MSRAPLGLYLHVPFCRQRCDFCAFYLEIHRETRAINFLNALNREICLYGAVDLASRHTIRSIYFGGGTPTTLSPRDLQEVLKEIRRCFTVASDAEVSIEAHPATVTDSMLVHLAQAGFNRISFGAESMEDQDFASIGRHGSVPETVGAVAMARAAGFANINLDLMYGLPGQSLASWRRTLKHIITLNPTHLSCYALTIEEGTKLAGRIAARTITVPDETRQIEMDDTAEEMLHRAGYIRYEISNYAKSGYACRHNLLYWTNGAYLGLGPSAESYVNGCRFGNIANLSLYEQALSENRLPVSTRAELSSHEQRRDSVIFGLRLLDGIPTQELEAHALHYGYTETLSRLRNRDLIAEAGSQSRLTERGRRYADTIAADLF